ncbi:MAG: hypothetical protein A4E38_00958 [Methanoregulaceae archaeon PtaB.Bin108]|nr:MAG: hypothetical protein A4E38_00958 [Methanoregulaceae archaeon PtaB.Bin108]
MMNRLGERLAAVLMLSFILIAPYIQPPWILAIMVIIFSMVLYLINRTRFLALALIPIAVLYGIGILPLLVFCCTLTILVMGELAFRETIDRFYSYFAYIIAAVMGCTLVMAYLNIWSPLVVLFGIIVAVLLKAILKEREDALMIEALGIGMTMFLIDELNYHADMALIAVAVAIAFAFGYFSYRTKTADVSGLLSAALIGIILIIFADIRWFLVVLAFFILGSASTRFKYEYKQRIGVEQDHGGARGYLNVFANGSVAAAAAVLWGVTLSPVFLALFVGSVATAAGDTMASEIGVTGGDPIMITSFARVPAGTNGGVTWIGEAVAVLGALVVSLLSFFLGIIDIPGAIMCVLAGFIGTNIDSLVGALMENPGMVGNAGTNFLATLCGGVCAVVFTYLVW